MARPLIVRGVPEEIGRRLEAVSRTRGTSIDAVVVDILETALGVEGSRRRLERYATWTAADRAECQDQAR